MPLRPRKSRELRPGHRYPVVKVIESVTMTTAGTLLHFTDGSELRLGVEDAIEIDEAPTATVATIGLGGTT